MKQLREHLADVADRAERGETFRVIRRSKPSFFIMHIDIGEIYDGGVDFTDEGRTEGVPIEEVMKELKKIRCQR